MRELLLRHLPLNSLLAISLTLLVALEVEHAPGVLVHLLVVGVHDTLGLGDVMVDLVEVLLEATEVVLGERVVNLGLAALDAFALPRDAGLEHDLGGLQLMLKGHTHLLLLEQLRLECLRLLHELIQLLLLRRAQIPYLLLLNIRLDPSDTGLMHLDLLCVVLKELRVLPQLRVTGMD
jgi:hypothetical protein